jgi:dihydrofolate reductase
MEKVLYMGLTANGCYAVVDESHSESSLPKEVPDNFTQQVRRIGNLIIGRRTYELFHTKMPGIRLLIVSRSHPTYNGVSVVASPVEALSLLEKEGFDTALVGGGATLVNTVLSQGLIDEIYTNIYPSISNGRTFAISEKLESNLELLSVAKLGADVVQLHYRVRR